MAEAITLIGLISSIASLVDISAKVASRLNDFHANKLQVPKTFRSLTDQLPLLTQTLNTIKDRAQDGSLGGQEVRSLRKVLENISGQLFDLQRRLEELVPGPNASKWERTYKSFKSVAKEDRLNEAMLNLSRDIDSVMLHQTTVIARTSDRLLRKVNDIKYVDASLPWSPEPSEEHGRKHELGSNVNTKASVPDSDFPSRVDVASSTLAWSTSNETTSQKDLQSSTPMDKDLHTLHDRYVQARLKRAYDAIDDWLGVPRFDQQFDKHITDRLEGTCKWILDNPSYCQWVSDEFEGDRAKFLWINGPAGFGKTVLCASLVQHLQASSTAPPVVHFFSSSHVANGGNLDEVVKSLLSQLVRVNRAALKFVYPLLMAATGRAASQTKVWEMFEGALSAMNDGFVLIDGLDEYPASGERKSFLTKLKKAAGPYKIRCLVASRSETDIEAELGDTASEPEEPQLIECKLSENDVGADVLLFSNKVVAEQLPKKDEQFRQELAAELATKCQGMILWIKLQRTQLRDGKSRKGLKAIVDSMPSGLDQSYQRNWTHIQSLGPDDRHSAILTLRWLTFARRPLTVAELSEALAIDRNVESTVFPFDDMPDSIDDDYVETMIKELCGSFVEVRQGADDESIHSRVVQTTHLSVQQFLMTVLPGPHASKSLEPASDPGAHESHLAKVCVRYLNFKEVWKPSNGEEGISTDRPFVDYATQFWSVHVANSTTYEAEIGHHLQQFFSPANTNFEAWVKHYETEEFQKASGDSWYGVYYAALFGLPSTIKFLFDLGQTNLDQGDQRYGTALEGACFAGKKDCYDILVRSGADVNVKAGEFGSALNTASAQGHETLVQDLLARGADLSIPDKSGRTALHLACQYGHIKVATLLLDAGASTSVADDDGSTSLHLAAGGGFHAIVKMLLLKESNTNTQNKQGQSALYLATFNGHLAVLRELLNHAGDVSLATTDERTPLYSATLNGHLDCLRELLLRGANIVTFNKNGWSPINAAAEKGYLEILKELLAHGGDFKTANKEGWTPVNTASSKGNLEIVKVLLEHNADVSIASNIGITCVYSAALNNHLETLRELLRHGGKDTIGATTDTGWSALNAAATKGHTQAIRELLLAGADLSISNDDGMEPLYSAALFGHVDAFRILLDHGANINTRNKNGWDAINAAAANGHLAMVQALVDLGVDISIPNADGATAVYSAARTGRVEIVELLIQHGGDIQVKNKADWTPLNAASYNGHLKVCQILLEQAADLSVGNSDGLTPVYSASALGHLPVVELLIDRGADITIKTTTGWTPVNAAASKGYVEILRRLMDAGADISVANTDGMTPIYTASVNGHYQCLKELINRGGDIHAVTKNQWNALCAAASNGHLEIVRELLQRKADVLLVNSDGRGPLILAALQGYTSVVDLLLEYGCDPAPADKIGITALHAAAGNGFLAATTLLLDHGAPLEAVDEGKVTALHLAARNGHIDVVEELLKRGADLHARTEDGVTPLFTSASGGQASVVRLLLEHGAVPSVVDINGWYSLSAAAWYGYNDIVTALLEHSADVNVRAMFDQTPLILAVVNAKRETAQLLVKSGADPTMIDGYGRTAIDWLKYLGTNDELLKSICDHPESPPQTNLQRLLESLVSISKPRPESDNAPRSITYGSVGRCFIYLEDEENARIAFHQGCKPDEDDPEVITYGASCDRCSVDLVASKTRYVCKVCQDTDLCSPCMPDYEKSPLDHCVGHPFMEVPVPVSPPMGEKEARSWLEQCIEKHSIKT